jgi:membrane protein DedA with SNARE-associated domain
MRRSGGGGIDLRLGRAALTPPVLALLHIHIHIHLHRQFHGPPFDYAGLALAAALSWIGVPGPGEPVLVAAGVLAARHELDLSSVLFVAFAAAAGGGAVGWAIGRVAGRKILTAPGPLLRLRMRMLERGEEVFARHAVLAILLTPAPIAGVHRVRPLVFLAVNTVSALGWALGFGLGSYLIGPSVIDAVGDLGVITAVGLGLLIAFAVWLEIRRRRGRAAGST